MLNSKNLFSSLLQNRTFPDLVPGESETTQLAIHGYYAYPISKALIYDLLKSGFHSAALDENHINLLTDQIQTSNIKDGLIAGSKKNLPFEAQYHWIKQYQICGRLLC